MLYQSEVSIPPDLQWHQGVGKYALPVHKPDNKYHPNDEHGYDMCRAPTIRGAQSAF